MYPPTSLLAISLRDTNSFIKKLAGYIMTQTLSGKEVIKKGKIVVADLTKDNLSRRGCKKVYGRGVFEALKRLWRVSGYASSKHLIGFIRLNPDKIFENPIIAKILTYEIMEELLLAYEQKAQEDK